MSKPYNEYLPKKREDEVRIQAMIERGVHEDANLILEKEGWTWSQFLEGLIKKYIDDNSKRRVG